MRTPKAMFDSETRLQAILRRVGKMKPSEAADVQAEISTLIDLKIEQALQNLRSDPHDF